MRNGTERIEGKMRKISEEYLLLARSRSLSKYEDFLLKIYCLFSAKTRKALRELKEAEQIFNTQQKERLGARLGISEVETSMRSGMYLKWAGSFALIALVSLVSVQMLLLQNAEYVAKGSELGVHLFSKGSQVTQLTEGPSTISKGDTLQFYPFAKEKIYVAIFGYSAKDGIYAIYPDHGIEMSLVSPNALPPALIPEDESTNRLLVISSKELLSGSELAEITSSSLDKKMKKPKNSDATVYVQIFDVGVK